MSDTNRHEAASFIQTARRAQLVACAIEVIAEEGLARASTVRIAERAGVSRGVLTYHFTSRAELIDEVINHVYDLAGTMLLPRIAQAATPREALREFIGGSVDLYLTHSMEMAALTAIFGAAAGDEGVQRARHERHGLEMRDLGRLLEDGQAQGQFRDFDVAVMARAIRGALDAALSHVAQSREAEPYKSELQTLFDAATTTTTAREAP